MNEQMNSFLQKGSVLCCVLMQHTLLQYGNKACALVMTHCSLTLSSSPNTISASGPASYVLQVNDECMAFTDSIALVQDVCDGIVFANSYRSVCGCRIAEGTAAFNESPGVDPAASRQTQAEAVAVEVMPFPA